MDKDILDLDGLVPEPRSIRFNGNVIKVNPPSTEAVLRLGALGQKMSTADAMEGEALSDLILKIQEQVVKCIPELAGQNLNANQLLKLVTLISNMGIPADAKALKDSGVTTDSGK